MPFFSGPQAVIPERFRGPRSHKMIWHELVHLSKIILPLDIRMLNSGRFAGGLGPEEFPFPGMGIRSGTGCSVVQD